MSIIKVIRVFSVGWERARMEFSKEQEREIMKMMAGTDCPGDFTCYKSKFENLPQLTIWRGANVIQCKQAERIHCPNSTVFCSGITFCECPFLRYVVFQLEKQVDKALNTR